MPTNTADIRPYLTSAYSDEELNTLCFDFFRDVYDNFAVGMTKMAKIQLLLDYCQRRDLIPNLLAALEQNRPGQFRKRAWFASPRKGLKTPLQIGSGFLLCQVSSSSRLVSQSAWMQGRCNPDQAVAG